MHSVPTKNLYSCGAVWDESGPKEVSAKLLVWFLAAVNIQIISIFPTILGSKSMLTFFTQFAPLNKHFGIKIVILTPKMVENEFENIRIFTAAENYTSNFSHTPFCPDYCSYSNVSLTTTPSNQPYF